MLAHKLLPSVIRPDMRLVPAPHYATCTAFAVLTAVCASHRAWHNIKAFMDTQLPALIQQQPQTHPQDQAAPREDSTGPFAQAVHTTDTTAHLAARQNQEHSTVVRALLPVVKSLPKDSVLQVMSVRSGSPAGCCNSGAAARQAASAEWVTQATAKQAPAAKSANEVVAADVATEAESTAAPTAAEAACVPQAAAHLFLTELHSTELFHVVGYCLSQAQRTAGHVLHRGQAEPDRLSGAAVSWETTAAFESTEVPKSSSVWHDLNVISGLGKSAAEMVLDKSAQHVSQQQLDDMHSTLCIVQEQQLSSAAVPTLGSSQTVPLVLGSSSHQDSDCSAPQKTAGDPTSPLSDMLTEMICMLLLLLPRTAWHCACDEVRCISIIHSHACALACGQIPVTDDAAAVQYLPTVVCSMMLLNSLVLPCAAMFACQLSVMRIRARGCSNMHWHLDNCFCEMCGSYNVAGAIKHLAGAGHVSILRSSQ